MSQDRRTRVDELRAELKKLREENTIINNQMHDLNREINNLNQAEFQDNGLFGVGTTYFKTLAKTIVSIKPNTIDWEKNPRVFTYDVTGTQRDEGGNKTEEEITTLIEKGDWVQCEEKDLKDKKVRLPKTMVFKEIKHHKDYIYLAYTARKKVIVLKTENFQFTVDTDKDVYYRIVYNRRWNRYELRRYRKGRKHSDGIANVVILRCFDDPHDLVDYLI